MFFDKVIELINASTKVAFALALAAVVIFVGQYYQKWPFTLLQDQLGYVLYAGIVGGGVLVFNFLWLVGALLVRAYDGCKLRLKKLTVLGRLGDLTLDQQAAILWIAHHSEATIQGSPLEEPFRGLCNRGFLYTTDKSRFPQAFRVNRIVYWGKQKIAAKFPKHIYDAIVNGDAPWKRRRL